MDSLQQFLPTTTDSNILDALYTETPIVAELGIEDFLKLPVNDDYKKSALQHSEQRFKVTDANKNVIPIVSKQKTNNLDKEKIISNIHDIFDV